MTGGGGMGACQVEMRLWETACPWKGGRGPDTCICQGLDTICAGVLGVTGPRDVRSSGTAWGCGWCSFRGVRWQVFVGTLGLGSFPDTSQVPSESKMEPSTGLWS